MKHVCQLCHKAVHIEMGKACKTCGMALEDNGKDFCSKTCRTEFIKGQGRFIY